MNPEAIAELKAWRQSQRDPWWSNALIYGGLGVALVVLAPVIGLAVGANLLIALAEE